MNKLNETTPAMWDAVNKPAHYQKAVGGIECIEAIKASMNDEQYKGYLKGNVQKYVWRYENHPNGKVQSLEKAQVYLKWLLQLELIEADR